MPRLLALLGQSDVSVYRAAVKGLGAFGATALQPLAELFSASSDGTVRACCVKAYAQIASNFPGQEFSADAMAVLEKALSDDSRGVAVCGDGSRPGRSPGTSFADSNLQRRQHCPCAISGHGAGRNT